MPESAIAKYIHVAWNDCPKRRTDFAALIWWWSGRIGLIHWIVFGRAWTGKKTPEISIRGNEIMREKRTAIPSLFAISPMIKPRVVLMIPTKRISCRIAKGEIAYCAPYNMKRIRMIRNWIATRAVKKISLARM